ncbi:hypothetical protein EDB89DRAFT_1918098 [Lactarius sanguifluus]|nr:hypothetical protein EDB89DRAFT_1918098 [Lactarius sanguifluus]
MSTPTSESVFVLPPLYASTIGFVCSRLLQIPNSEANAAKDFATSVTYSQLDLVQSACHLLLQKRSSYVLAFDFTDFSTPGCFRHHTSIRCQLLREHGVLPDELGGHVPADNVSHIQPPTPDTTEPIDTQEARVPADSDTSGKLFCPVEGCQANFRRQQELNRHTTDVHTPPHRCPFCIYRWSRSDKIRVHLVTKHQDEPQVLDEIHAKRGQNLVAYLLATFPEIV